MNLFEVQSRYYSSDLKQRELNFIGDVMIEAMMVFAALRNPPIYTPGFVKSFGTEAATWIATQLNSRIVINYIEEINALKRIPSDVACQMMSLMVVVKYMSDERPELNISSCSNIICGMQSKIQYSVSQDCDLSFKLKTRITYEYDCYNIMIALIYNHFTDSVFGTVVRNLAELHDEVEIILKRASSMLLKIGRNQRTKNFLSKVNQIGYLATHTIMAEYLYFSKSIEEMNLPTHIECAGEVIRNILNDMEIINSMTTPDLLGELLMTVRFLGESPETYHTQIRTLHNMYDTKKKRLPTKRLLGVRAWKHAQVTYILGCAVNYKAIA